MYNNKIVGLIIPTRCNSFRLDGKALCDIAGKKQIEWIIERAERSKYIDKIILAISDEQGKEIIDWSIENGSKYPKLSIFTGTHNDIIKRCLFAACYFNIDIIVDTSHDCTFFDPYLADTLIERLFYYNADYSSNCITRSFPNGFDIQVYKKEVYESIYNQTEYNPKWTGWNIWHNREDLKPKPRIINLEAMEFCYYPEWHLCLDTEEDKIVIESILNKFPENYCPKYYEIISFLTHNKHLLEINKSVEDTKLLKERIK